MLVLLVVKLLLIWIDKSFLDVISSLILYENRVGKPRGKHSEIDCKNKLVFNVGFPVNQSGGYGD